MIDKLYKKMKKKEKEKAKAQKKYNSLSLQDRNSYEEIIDRHTVRIYPFTMFFDFFKFMIGLGLFFIVTSYVGGIDISLFRDSYFAVFRLLPIYVFAVVGLSLLTIMSNRIRLNKLKLKLLS